MKSLSMQKEPPPPPPPLPFSAHKKQVGKRMASVGEVGGGGGGLMEGDYRLEIYMLQSICETSHYA